MVAMSGHVISGLLRRRRELAGDLLELLGRVDALSDDIEALDATLRLFDPGIVIAAIPAQMRRPKPDWAGRGEVVRLVFAILREAREPLSTLAIASAVLARRGIDGNATRLHLKRIRKCLDRQSAKGLLRAEQVGGVLHWRAA